MPYAPAMLQGTATFNINQIKRSTFVAKALQGLSMEQKHYFKPDSEEDKEEEAKRSTKKNENQSRALSPQEAMSC